MGALDEMGIIQNQAARGTAQNHFCKLFILNLTHDL